MENIRRNLSGFDTGSFDIEPAGSMETVLTDYNARTIAAFSQAIYDYQTPLMFWNESVASQQDSND